MSERIKRYMMIAESHTCGDGTPGAKVREAEHPIGAWCRSTDVAAIEAENARLRLVEDAADSMATALILFRPETMHSADVKRRALAAYDAAKAQATQQGEKKE